MTRATASRSASRSVPSDLEEMAREAVNRAPGLKLSAIKKSLPVSHQKFWKEAQICVRTLASGGSLALFKKGKVEHAFPSDPFAKLDREVRSLVGDGSLDKAALKALVSGNLAGYEVVLDPWVKHALEHGILFEHGVPKGPKSKSKSKRFATKPDLSPLKAALEHVRELLDELEKKGLERAYLAKIAVEALAIARTLFVSALNALSAENPRQAMLSVRELRPRVPLSKVEFDRLALDLMREGTISLHYHDHAAALPEAERLQFVQDQRGTYFNGIALRSSE